MLSCSALAGLSFMLNFIFEFGMIHETWLLVLSSSSSSKVLWDFLLLFCTYHKSKALTNGTKFTCSKRKSEKCKAFVVVSDDGTVVKAKDSHNHQPNPGDVQVRQLRGNMRK